jgi:hypothetical protein
MKDISNARALRIRKSGFQIEALSDELKAQVALLDDDEIAVLESVKEKLNRGLAENLKNAADTVGGFVW